MSCNVEFSDGFKRTVMCDARSNTKIEEIEPFLEGGPSGD